MKIFHLLWVLVQIPLALIARNANRIAYLVHLVGWNSKRSDTSPKGKDKTLRKHSGFMQTHTDTTDYEYSFIGE